MNRDGRHEFNHRKIVRLFRSPAAVPVVLNCLVQHEASVVRQHLPSFHRACSDDRSICCQMDMSRFPEKSNATHALVSEQLWEISFFSPSWSICSPSHAALICICKSVSPSLRSYQPKSCSDKRSQNIFDTPDKHGWFCCRTVSLVATFGCTRDRSSDCSWAGYRIAVLDCLSPRPLRSRSHRFSLWTFVWEKRSPFLAHGLLCTRSDVAFADLRSLDPDNISHTIHTLRHEHSRTARYDTSHSSSCRDIAQMNHRQERISYFQSQAHWFDSHWQRQRTILISHSSLSSMQAQIRELEDWACSAGWLMKTSTTMSTCFCYRQHPTSRLRSI